MSIFGYGVGVAYYLLVPVTLAADPAFRITLGGCMSGRIGVPWLLASARCYHGVGVCPLPSFSCVCFYLLNYTFHR